MVIVVPSHATHCVIRVKILHGRGELVGLADCWFFSEKTYQGQTVEITGHHLQSI
jgi:hypothetical protein